MKKSNGLFLFIAFFCTLFTSKVSAFNENAVLHIDYAEEAKLEMRDLNFSFPNTSLREYVLKAEPGCWNQSLIKQPFEIMRFDPAHRQITLTYLSHNPEFEKLVIKCSDRGLGWSHEYYADEKYLQDMGRGTYNQLLDYPNNFSEFTHTPILFIIIYPSQVEKITRTYSINKNIKSADIAKATVSVKAVLIRPDRYKFKGTRYSTMQTASCDLIGFDEKNIRDAKVKAFNLCLQDILSQSANDIADDVSARFPKLTSRGLFCN